MRERDLARHKQPQPQPTRLVALLMDDAERAEQHALQFRRNDALIVNRDRDAVGGGPVDDHADARLAHTVVGRVADEIREHLHHAVGVPHASGVAA